MKYFLAIASVAALTACGSGTPAPETEPAALPAEVLDIVEPAPSLSASILFPVAETNSLIVPDFLSVTPMEDGSVVLSGNDVNLNSGGSTSGVAIKLTPEQEALASGKAVTVKILARSTSESPAPLSVAYSTAEVGNSGWQDLTFESDWTEQSFVYDVPELVSGFGDFIGLSPRGTDVVVASIGLDIEE